LAIEVKATRGSGPHLLRINGEDQLNGSEDGLLLFVALEVDVQENGAGESLPEAVERARRTVGASLAGILDRKLEIAGYLPGDEHRYAEARYTLLAAHWHRVEGDFPRITRQMLMEGLGGVTYLLSLDACKPWRIDDADVPSLLTAETTDGTP
jgi:hypothetical protein